MKILLINPPVSANEIPKQVSFGIAYIAQELKRNHHDVEMLDIYGNMFSKEEVIGFIRRSSADIVGIGGLITIYPYLDWLIPEIKRLKPGIEIILGGGMASSLREKCFKRFDIDYAVIGEGEATIIELLKELSGDRHFSSVKGIGFRENGNIVFTEKRPLMESLDNIPLIDYALFSQDKILKNALGVLQIHVQRGCPGDCTFCFNCFRVVSEKVRYRPVNNVIDEIESLKGRYKVKMFNLSGECVMLDKKWIIDFCKEVFRRKLKIKYRVTSRVDTVDEERLEWLKKTGCAAMSLGLETGSEKILKIMKKRVTVEQGRKSAMLAKKYIPEIEAAIMLGYIGEDEDTLRETVKFVKDIGIRPQLIYYATAFPGTELYKMAIAKNRINDEESYLMNLDKLSILSFSNSVNLTNMPDDKAGILIRSAIRDINRHYFYKELLNFRLFRPGILKRALSSLVRNGFRKTIIKASMALGLNKS